VGDMPSRHEVAKQLGRRVSRGEYERLLNLQFSHKSRVQSTSRGKRTGVARVTTVLHPAAPKAKRKHGAAAEKDERARYEFK